MASIDPSIHPSFKRDNIYIRLTLVFRNLHRLIKVDLFLGKIDLILNECKVNVRSTSKTKRSASSCLLLNIFLKRVDNFEKSLRNEYSSFGHVIIQATIIALRWINKKNVANIESHENDNIKVNNQDDEKFRQRDRFIKKSFATRFEATQ